MASTKETIHCPKCNKKIRVRVLHSVDGSRIVEIVSRDLFKMICPSCSEKIVVDYPLEVIGKNYLVYYTPGVFEEKSSDTTYLYKRICPTFDDFKEKLLIFEDSFDDIVIEFIKRFLVNQLDEEIKDKVSDIRYDGCTSENLIFYLSGVKKSIGCPLSFYEEIKKRSKIKTCKKCILIDESTYKKYFKLR